jgi:hypothetical protein
MPEQVKLTPDEISDTLPKLSLIKPFKFGDIIIHPVLTPFAALHLICQELRPILQIIILHCNIAALKNIC